MNNDIEEEKIYKALTDACIPFEVLRTEDGWLEIGFCIVDRKENDEQVNS